MKSVTDFFDEIQIHREAIRLCCKQELTAMADAFCKSKEVKSYSISINRNDHYDYCEYTLFDIFKFQSGGETYKAVAVRYYIQTEKWTLIDKKHCLFDEIDIDYMDMVEEMVELVTLLKFELFE